jgi:hypothetical protein
MDSEVNKQFSKSYEENRLIVYGIYTNFIQNIKHFDTLQTFYRIMTSTILLATFVAIGFILSAENKNLSINNFLVVIFVCAVGWMAILSLWHLDLIFCERLYASSFIEALKLEKQNEWLPKVHHSMLYGVRGTFREILGHSHSTKVDKQANVVIFYIGCTSSLIVIAGIASYFLCLNCAINSTVYMTASILGTCLTLILNFFFLKKKTGNIVRVIRKMRFKRRD